MASPAEWSQGYARQSDADFKRFMRLDGSETDDDVEVCHSLQFLQMACEKLVKAHLCGTGTDPHTIQTSHAYIAKTLPVILRQQASDLKFSGKKARAILQHSKYLAEEIELLAPAVKRGGGRPDNCEYPWEDGAGKLHLPLNWSFIPAHLLELPAGRTFLKLVREAISRLL